MKFFFLWSVISKFSSLWGTTYNPWLFVYPLECSRFGNSQPPFLSEIDPFLHHAKSCQPQKFEFTSAFRSGQGLYFFHIFRNNKSKQTLWRMTMGERWWWSEWLPVSHHWMCCSTNSLAIAILYLEISLSCKF